MALGWTARPRPRPGAFFTPWRIAAVGLLALAGLAPATPAAAQKPKRPPADTAVARRDTASAAADTGAVIRDTSGVSTRRDTTQARRGVTGLRQDTTGARQDTTGARQDTTGAQQDTTTAPADTVPPPPFLPLPAARDSGAAAGVWIFTRADMLSMGATTLGDLLDRVPGVIGFHQGYYGEPETASVYGTGAGGIQLYEDGTPLDPLSLNSVDLSRLPLANLRAVRVERGLGGLRVELSTLGGSTIPAKVNARTDSLSEVHPDSLTHYSDRPFSYIEAQAGEPLGLNVFRGVFLTPHFLVGPVAVGVERTAASGLGSDEPTNLFNAWAKWSIVRPSRAVQIEYNTVSADRGGSAPFGGKLSRSDLTLRARTLLPVPHLVAELYASESSMTDSLNAPTTGAGTAPAGSLAVHTPSERQLGLRLGYDTPRLWGGGALRWRSAAWLPKLQASVRLATRPVSLLTLSARGQWTDWRKSGSGRSGTLRLELGPFAHVTAFAEISGGTYGIARAPWNGGALPPDTTLPDSIAQPLVPGPTPLVDRRLERAGLSLSWGGLRVTGAALQLRTDSVFGFGAPFDSISGGYPGGQSRGVEVEGSMPLFWSTLRVGGSFTRWLNSALWPYLPQAEGRGGLYLHAVPLKSGNLEITADLEGVYRGSMLEPSASDSSGYQLFAPRTVVNAYVQIRIVTVRAFLRYENLAPPLDNLDFPGRTLLNSHIIYGVKWELWN